MVVFMGGFFHFSFIFNWAPVKTPHSEHQGEAPINPCETNKMNCILTHRNTKVTVKN